MNYRWTGHFATRDCKRHIPHRFSVPTHCGQIELHLAYTPTEAQGIGNLLTLTLFDPTGFRGAGHRGGSSHRVWIAADQATPGYLPGPLPPGEWTAEIDTHMIMPGPPVVYTLDVRVTTGEAPLESGSVKHGRATPKAASRGAGWYRGDLHTHTDHSDAEGCTVTDLVGAARRHGLDFLFLTDHNTTAGQAELEALGDDQLLTAPGIELTTYWGHALVLGTREWVDWRIQPGTREINRLAEAAYAREQAFIVAHPQSPGDPGCTGCAWRLGEMMPGNVRMVEVWNGPWAGDSNNEAALALWYDWLNQGYRLVATTGTDTHSVRDYDRGPGFSVVYAQALSESSILAALRAGHLYLSAGPTLDLWAIDAAGARWMMGDTVPGGARFHAAWNDCPEGARLRVMANGRVLHQEEIGARGEYAWSLAAGEADWVVVEIRRQNGEMAAVSNPLHCHPVGVVG